MPREKLTADEAREGVRDLEGWEVEGDQIVKEYSFDDFPTAIAFINRVAEKAEAANHHPDLDNRYNRVRVALSTHDAGGITEADVDLARQIESVA